MVATIAAGTSAQYYLAQVEYYLGGREPAGRWLAAGPGLGVTLGSVVERDLFERLHAARNETGASLLSNSGGQLERVAGYDVTFSAPKSVSLLWGLGDDELRRQIEDAQEQAVRAAIALLDGNAAFCRRGKGGQIREAVHLTVAAFQHGEARPTEHEDGAVFGDMGCHTHSLVLAAAQRADGSFGALDGKALFAWKMAAGATYHAELAYRLQRLGLAVENTGVNGLFEVAGVDRDLCAYFSARRHEIERELVAAGVERTADAPAFAAAKARATRASKLDMQESSHDRHRFWRDIVSGRGFAPDRVIEAARARGLEANTVLHDPEAREALIRERVDTVPRQLTETQSLFEHRHLVATVAAALVGTGASAERAASEVERMVNAGAVIALGRDARWPHPIYSTPEVIALERDLLARATTLASHRVGEAPSPARVEELIVTAGLNPEQAQAARVATLTTALTIIEGAPGVGKTTLLAPVTQSWAEAGWTVIGAASAWKVAHLLRDELSIEARAIDSWLARAEHGRPFLRDRTLLVVDEAGLLSSRQLHRVLAHVDQARRSGLEVAVRLVGDRKQLQAIGGPGLRIVADAIGTQRVDSIVCQREAWAREMVTAFGAGHADTALALLDAHSATHECDGAQGTVAAIVAAWQTSRRAHPQNPDPLLLAKSNRQVLQLNAAVRAVLRRDGAIDREDALQLDAVTPSGREHRLDLAIGDRLRFLARVDAIGVVNGTEAILVDVRPGEADGDGHDARLTVRIGMREASFAAGDLADERGRVRLAHSYGSTIAGSQGLTCERVMIWADPSLDRHDAFVAASRARGEARLFVDRQALDAKVKSDRPLNDRKRPVSPDERREALARALSRSGEKASTLDYTNAEGTPSMAVGQEPQQPDPSPRADAQPTAKSQVRSHNRGLGLDA